MHLFSRGTVGIRARTPRNREVRTYDFRSMCTGRMYVCLTLCMLHNVWCVLASMAAKTVLRHFLMIKYVLQPGTLANAWGLFPFTTSGIDHCC